MQAQGGKKRKRRAAQPAAAGRPGLVARLEGRLSPKRLRLWVLGLLGIMVAIRAYYFLDLGHHLVLSADSEFFISLGRRIAGGDIFLQGESLIFSPLYYYFLGSVFAVFGETYQWALIIQFLLGIAGAYLLFLLAKDLFGPLAGLFTLALAAFYGLFVAYEGQILDASFSVFLPALFLWLLRRASVDGRFLWWLAAGLALGLFGLTRPNVMVFFPVAAAWALFAGRERWPLARRLRGLAGVVLGIACCFLPFTVRNFVMLDEPVLVTAHGGINFYVGNNPRATGFFTPPAKMPPLPGVFNLEVPRQVAEAQTGRTEMTDAEVSSYWLQQGLEFIRRQPERFVQLTLRKARAFFNAHELPLNVDFYLLRDISHSLKITFVPLGVLLPLGLVGMGLALRKWRTHWVFLLYFVTYAASVILFFIAARYRLPVVPVLMLYGGFAVKAALESLGRPGRFLAIAGALVLLLLLVNTNLPVRLNPAIVAHGRGHTLESMGKLREAVGYYQQALRLNPGLLGAHFNLARIYAQTGKFRRAWRHGETALRLAPEGTPLHGEVQQFLEDLARQAPPRDSGR